MHLDEDTKTVWLGVRELARSPYSALGGLHGGQEARAAIGRDVHQRLTAGATRREEAIREDIPWDGWTVRLAGRVDGIVEEADGGWVVREIKTRFEPFHRAPAEPRPDERRQLEVYLALLRRRHPELALRGELVEVFPASGRQRVHATPVPDLDVWLRAQVAPWVAWAKTVVRHCQRRRGLDIRFPHDAPRLAQQAIAVAVADSYEAEKPLLLAAPTGSGKTAAVLTAALRLASETGRQVLWLTAKTPQQALPLELGRRLAKGLRVVQLASKERLCLNGTVFCHPAVCSYLREEPAKMEAAWPDLEKRRRWLPRTARQLGEAHAVCPHLLGKRQVDIADLVIADFNYAFGPDCLLQQVVDKEAAERWILVVDEAHNLAERGRDYFRATLPRGDDPRLDRRLPPDLRDAVAELCDGLHGVYASHIPLVAEEDFTPVSLGEDDRATLDGLSMAAARALLMAVEEVELPVLQELLQVTDEIRDFLRLSAADNEAQLTVVARGQIPRLQTLCLDASAWLAERHRLFHHAVFMSATLHPAEYYQRLLGIGDCVVRTVESDFAASQRQVLIVPTVSTLYRDRAASLPALAALLGEIAANTPGRGAVFLPSFDYLDQVAGALSPAIRVFRQERGGGLARLQQQVADFAATDRALFLSVTSGLLGEGVDFGDGVLQCLTIVGPALPAVSGEAQLRRQYYDAQGEDGFIWTYACPGMLRVVQAAGRLIRRPEDRGQIVLIDRRFVRSPYRELLPPEWEPVVTRDPGELIRAFWRGGLSGAMVAATELEHP